MVGFKMPLDAYVLMLPIAYASVAMLTITLRVPLTDPESTNAAFYDDEKKSASVAQSHDRTFRQFFDARVKSHRVGVFQNWFEGSPQ